MVRVKDIIGIFDIQAELSSAQQSERPSNEPFSQLDREAVRCANDTKSYVVTDKQVYYSQVSSQTLKRRALHLDFIDEAD